MDVGDMSPNITEDIFEDGSELEELVEGSFKSHEDYRAYKYWLRFNLDITQIPERVLKSRL